MSIAARLKTFPLSKVDLSDNYCKNAWDKEIAYLKGFDPDKLLAGFRETRGLAPRAGKYPGWERTELRGHTMGHFLKAMAQAYEASSDPEILKTLEYIYDELALCQFDNGYLSAFPVELFERIERGERAWAPLLYTAQDHRGADCGRKGHGKRNGAHGA